MSLLSQIQNNENGVLENPSLLSEYLVRLAANIGEADKQRFEAEVAYSHKWTELRKETESDKQCDMKLKLEPEYIELKSKESLCKVLLQTIQAIKKRLNFLAVEYQQLT